MTRKKNDIIQPIEASFDDVTKKVTHSVSSEKRRIENTRRILQEENGQSLLDLRIIPHEVDGDLIPQRMADGYVNATAMCQAVGKKFNDYSRLKYTKEFLNELVIVTGIPVTTLIIQKQAGNKWQQGTWVHPDVAIHLAQWCSPKFAVAVSRWVREWMTGSIKGKAELPYHLRRYLANRSEIPPTHFSILNELTFNLIAPLEDKGYELPENLVPDISQGKMFCRWLRQNGEEPNDFPTYNHRYEDGRVVRAKLYPNRLLADFRKHFYTVWIPEKMVNYFKKKDSKALPYLPEIIEYSQIRLFENSTEEETEK